MFVNESFVEQWDRLEQHIIDESVRRVYVHAWISKEVHLSIKFNFANVQ